MTSVTFDRDKLAPALRTLTKVPPWRLNDKTPGLVRIATVGGTATLVSVDADMQLEISIDCSPEPASIVLFAPLASLAPLVERFPQGAKVRLTAVDGATVVASGRSRSTLPGLPAHAMLRRAPLTAPAQSMPAPALVAGLRAALPAAIDDSARPFLGGVHIRDLGGAISFEAQDGTRIHAAARQDAAGMRGGASIPQRAARLIADLLPLDGSAHVAVDDRAVQVTAGNIRITSSLLDARFPSIEAQLAVPTSRILRGGASTLLAAVDLIMTVANPRDRDFRLDLGATCIASAFNPGGDYGQVELECAYEGTPLAIGFQFHLVRDALQLFGSSPVEWRLGEADHPSIITSPDHPGVEAMVSPFRLAADHLRRAA